MLVNVYDIKLKITVVAFSSLFESLFGFPWESSW